jgi:beta-glucosidase
LLSCFTRRYTAKFLWSALLLWPITCGAQTVGTPAPPLYLDPDAPTDKRVDDLVSRMTPDEKLSQLVEVAAGIPRLNVPPYLWANEALHGIANGTATVFPEPIGLAATFDTKLIFDIGEAIGTEGRAKYHEAVRQGDWKKIGLDFWAPNINIFRDPRWGRGQETYGEDPFLTAQMAVAYVQGMQGSDPHYFRVIATPKHFAVHSGPEPARHSINVVVSKHDEEDTYLPAFRAAIVEGYAGSVMCAYNRINGEPACANTFLLQDELREKWKFSGYVVSDCDSVADMQQGHHYTKTMEEAAAISMQRGTDLDCDIPGTDYSKYADAFKAGLLDSATLDRTVKRLMAARFALGLFDPPERVAYSAISASENDSAAHRQLALKAAEESMVLLKNDGTLPLAASIKRIAVVGPLADQVRVLEGNYNGTPSRTTTVLQGIEKEFVGREITFAPGTQFLRSADAIPTKVLTAGDGKPGLQAEYFKGRDLAGPPALRRLDAQVDFDFTGADLVPEVGKENFSVRWKGYLTPEKSGEYQIGTIADDGYRLRLDGRMVMEDWTTHGASPNLKSVVLEKGRRYAIELEYFQGEGGAVAKLVWTLPGPNPLESATAAARNSDVVIAVVGITSDLEGEENGVNQEGFKGGDRTSLELPAEEGHLLEAVAETGKPLVVVLLNGSALAVRWASSHANAILESWYPGEEGGLAVAETLQGRNNPSGRLPVTFYSGVEQLPAFEDYSMKGRTYRYFEGVPIYTFGDGLSYSKFVYGKTRVRKPTITAGRPLQVDTEVRNISARDGDEVVEVYITFSGQPGAPTKALRAFTRIHLTAGASQKVSFTLSPRDLSFVNEAGDRMVQGGGYSISVGGSQPGGAAGTVERKFTIVGTMTLPE